MRWRRTSHRPPRQGRSCSEARDSLRRLRGDLLVVTYQPDALPEGFKTFEAVEEAVAAVKEARRRR